MLEPIVATEKYNRVDINIKAWGGGYSGQAQAIRHALGRALVNDDPENRYEFFLVFFSRTVVNFQICGERSCETRCKKKGEEENWTAQGQEETAMEEKINLFVFAGHYDEIVNY
jgi:hypothetical protein